MFLWCLPAARPFPRHEIAKPVEWVIKVRANRILGFVDDKKWDEYLKDKGPLDREVFAAVPPPAHEHEYSVLVTFPLQKEELVCKTVFEFVTPDEAKIRGKEKFNPS